MHIIYKSKTYKHNPKGSPVRYCFRKNKRQIKLGDAGTIDRFGLAFQFQIFKKYKKKKNELKQLQIKILYNTTN